MDLLLIRHGQCGSVSVDDDLTKVGEWQAQRLGKRLAGRSITVVVSSPLLRALGTAASIVQYRDAQIIEVWPELREGLFEAYEGYTNEQLQERFSSVQLAFPMGKGLNSYEADTQETMYQRCLVVFERLQQRFGEKDIVALVMHGGMITYLLHVILQTSPQVMSWFEVKYASMSWVRLFGEERRIAYPPLYPPMQVAVRCINDTSHLKK